MRPFQAVRECYPLFVDYDRDIVLGLGKDHLQIELRKHSEGPVTPELYLLSPTNHPDVPGTISKDDYVAWAEPGAALDSKQFANVVAAEIRKQSYQFARPVDHA